MKDPSIRPRPIPFFDQTPRVVLAELRDDVRSVSTSTAWFSHQTTCQCGDLNESKCLIPLHFAGHFCLVVWHFFRLGKGSDHRSDHHRRKPKYSRLDGCNSPKVSTPPNDSNMSSNAIKMHKDTCDCCSLEKIEIKKQYKQRS